MVVFIFSWLFLDLAPKLQLINMPQQLINTSTVVVDRVALDQNLICALFMVGFTLFYSSLNRRAGRGPKLESKSPADAPRAFTALAVGAALIVCVAVVAAAAPSAYASIDSGVTATPASIVVKRCLLFIPSATLLILLHETVGSGRKLLFSRVCVLLILFMLGLITENPYTEKRNALGPLYIAMLLVAFPVWFSRWNLLNDAAGGRHGTGFSGDCDL